MGHVQSGVADEDLPSRSALRGSASRDHSNGEVGSGHDPFGPLVQGRRGPFSGFGATRRRFRHPVLGSAQGRSGARRMRKEARPRTVQKLGVGRGTWEDVGVVRSEDLWPGDARARSRSDLRGHGLLNAVDRRPDHLQRTSPQGAAPARPAAVLTAWRDDGRLVLLLTYLAAVGIPADPISVFIWLWSFAVAWRWGQPAHRHLDFVREVVARVGRSTLLFYTYTRAIADNLGTGVHVWLPVRIDTVLGGGVLPMVRLQQALRRRHVLGPGRRELVRHDLHRDVRDPLLPRPAPRSVPPPPHPRKSGAAGRGSGSTGAGPERPLRQRPHSRAAPPWIAASQVAYLPQHVSRMTGRGGGVLGIKLAGNSPSARSGTTWPPCRRCTPAPPSSSRCT